MEILQTSNSTKLTMDDVQNICDDYKNGMSRNNIQKKYNIGGNRIAKILNANNITKNSKYIIVRDAPNFIETPKRIQSSNPSNSDDDNINKLLTTQIENMKKSMENIQFKSFI